MPFISIQSIYKKVVSVITNIIEYLVTSEIYDVNNSSTGLGRPSLSSDGQWLCASTGGYNYVDSEIPSVKIYKRNTGPGTSWQYIQDLELPGMTDQEKYLASWGVFGAVMSKDASRAAVFYYDENGNYRNPTIAVFSRSGDVWTLEDTLPQSTEPVFSHHDVTFNTTTGVDATNDYITTDDPNEFIFATPVVYFKDGGTANVGLVDVTADNYVTYYTRPIRNFYASTALIFAIRRDQDETNYNNTGDNGTFNGGTGHAIGNVITLSNGTTVLVDNVSAGVVTEFTVTKGSTSSTTATFTYSQTSTTGSGINFSLTPKINNMEMNMLNITSHSFTTGDPIRFYSWNGGDDIIYKNLVEVTQVYYVRSHSVNVLSLYPTLTDANNDTNRIDLDYQLAATGVSVMNGGTGYSAGDMVELVGGSGDAPAYVWVYTVGGTGNITAAYILQSGGIYNRQGLPDTILIQGQSQTSYNNSPTTEGTFAGGTGYTVGNVLTLSNGSTVTVNTVSGGVVTGFTVTTASTTPTLPNVTLTSSGGSGTGFTLTPEESNLRYYTTSTGGTGTGATFSPTFTTSWTTGGQPHTISHAKKFQLFNTPSDAQSQINRLQLTSTGGETHRLGISLGTSPALNFGTCLQINNDGSRIISPQMIGHNRKVSMTVYDRVGTSWSETNSIELISPNTINLLDPAQWSPSYGSFYTRAIDGLALSGEGDTFAVNATIDTEYGLQDITGMFSMVASNPLYGNATTLEISPLLENPWARTVVAGRIFELDTYPDYNKPYFGTWRIVSVESPTLLVVEPISNGSFVTPVPTDFTTTYMVLRWEKDFSLIYHWNGTSWGQQAALTSPEGTSENRFFGQAGAGFSSTGDVLAVSDNYAPWSSSDQGRVYVYERTAGVWNYTESLAPGINWIQRMGTSVAVSDTGHEIVCGAPWYGPDIESSDTPGYIVTPENYVNYWPRPPFQQSSSSGQNYAAGKAYLFTRPNGASPYVLEDAYSPLPPHQSYGGDFVDISGDGSIVAIGFPETPNFEGSGSLQNGKAGAIAIWERLSYATPTEVNRYYADFIYSSITPGLLPSGSGSANFGYTHKVSKDGSTLISIQENSTEIKVYAASWAGPALSWTLSTSLFPTGATIVKSIDINDDGTKIVASCDVTGGQAIVTFVYSGSWTEYVQTNPVDTTFGATLVMSSDGSTLAIQGTLPNYFASFNTGTGVNATTDVITTSTPHEFSYGSAIEIAVYSRQGGVSNIGLTDGMYYWIRRVSPTQFSVHSSLSNANSNVKVQLTSTGTETHRFTRQANRDYAFVYKWNGGTNQWDLESDKIYASQISYRNFGKSMAISGEGNTLALATEWQSITFNQAAPNTTGSRGRNLFEYRRYTAPTFTPEWVTVLQAGTGYAVNDILTISSGTPSASAATIRVTAIGGSGEITAAVIETANTYIDVSDSLEAITFTGGTGSNASLRVWWNGARYVIDFDQAPVITAPGSTYDTFSDGLFFEGGTPEIIWYLINVDTVDGGGGLTGVSVTNLVRGECVYTSIPNPNVGHPIVGNNTGVGGEVKFFWKLAAEQYNSSGVLWKKVRDSGQVADEFFQPSNITAGYTNSENVISMSDDGSIVAVGDDLTNFVYVFERNNSTQGARALRNILIRDLTTDFQAATTEPSIRADAGFGARKGVCVSPDGSHIIVGAWKFQGAYVEEGAVFVYKKENNQWVRKNRLSSAVCNTSIGYSGSSLPNNSYSGSSVSASNDASIINLSAPGCDTIFTFTTTNPGANPGCPVVVGDSGISSLQLRTVVNSETSTEFETIGQSVSMSSDGSRMVVGGATPRIYVRFADGWVLEQELVLPGTPALATRIADSYGSAVAMNALGDTVVVGAQNTAVGAGTENGAIHVFSRAGTAWTHVDELTPTGLADFSYFGIEVAIYGDSIVLGACAGASSAYLFRKISGVWTESPDSIDPPIVITTLGSISYASNGTGRGTIALGGKNGTSEYVWIYDHVYDPVDNLPAETITYVTQISAPGASNDQFGVAIGAVRLSADGSHLVVSDPAVSLFAGETTGEVYVYQNTNGTANNYDPAGPWTQIATITPTNLNLPIFFSANPNFPIPEFGKGIAVSPNGSKLLIAAPPFSNADVTTAYNASLYWGGSAWVFEKQGATYAVVPEKRLFPRSPNGQWLGTSVATDDSMDIIVLGGPELKEASMVPTNTDLTYVGQAHIYEYAPETVAPTAYTGTGYIEDYDNSMEGNYYGEGPLEISKDGSTLAITYAYGASTTVDVYTNVAGVWTWQQSPSTGTTGVSRIHLSDDGNTMVVIDENSWAITTLKRTAGVWSAVNTFTPTDPGADPTFEVQPWEFSLSGDGLTLAILTAVNPAVNRTFIYVWNVGTTSWDLQDYTTATAANVFDSNGGPISYGFGSSLSHNGNWLAVAGYRYVDAFNVNNLSPAVFVFHRVGTTWSHHSTAVGFWYSQSPSTSNRDARVRITGDGTRMLVTAPVLNKVWVLRRDLNTDRTWVLDGILSLDENIAADYSDWWGSAISEDGKLAVIGNAFGAVASLDVWRLQAGYWNKVSTLVNQDGPANGSYFGFTLAADGLGKYIATEDNYSINDNGLVWTFTRDLEADEMQPFPFATYGIDSVIINSGPPTGTTNHYYNDPTLDAAQLNVRIFGDGWEDTTYDVYFGFGLMSGVTSPRLWGMEYVALTGEVYDYGPGLAVSGPQVALYQASTYPSISSDGSPQPQPQGTYEFPGVATTSVLFSSNSYLEVPCYGRPLSYEEWYSENPSKTNANVKFSGYTHFGDFNGGHPEMYPIVPGYVRRMLFGILKKDADLATCTTGDIVAGVMFNGTDTHGEAHVVVNGVIKATISSNVLIYGVGAYFDPYMADPVANFQNFSQVFDYIEVVLYDTAYNNIGYAGFLGGAGNDPAGVTPIDTYNVKYGWYYDFVPDAGPGTYSGNVFANPPTMFTHPGWPV